ncbi:MAG: hypothetical protein LBJ96_05295, partial [Holosporaceae bacterium]|nr:hypothetical protein [Holosporaceae bacterium]
RRSCFASLSSFVSLLMLITSSCYTFLSSFGFYTISFTVSIPLKFQLPFESPSAVFNDEEFVRRFFRKYSILSETLLNHPTPETLRTLQTLHEVTGLVTELLHPR